ncbi:unnamed protein product [Phytophthora lilii]|uniref:Unnamed protein product n=1 Tax=Phytophthora lilii TaxID=2077276 RepID=A0A9W6TDC7_9STRA|nr:unnamed protein product [Phytophthora lilii]
MAARVASSPTSSQTASSTQNSASTSSVAASEGIQSKMSSADSKDPHENNAVSPPSSKRAASALPASDYSTFVQDVARQCQWTEKVVHNVLRCMQHSIELYRTNKLVAFFSKIASLTPGGGILHTCILFREADQGFGTLDGFENLVLTAPGINSSITSAENTKEEQDGVPQNAFDTVSVTANTHRSVGLENTNQQQQPEQETVEGQRNQTPLPGSPAQTPHEDAGTNYDPDLLGSPAEMLEKGSEDTGIDNNDGQSYLIGSPAQAPQTDNEDVGASGDHDCSGSPTQTPQTRNGDAINNSDHEQSLYFGSPGQTPQTGNEDAADEHSSMTGGKQSSPEDSWDDEVDVDIDMEDDGLDNQSVGSPDNASSSPAYPLSGELASSSSKKPSKRGKDEQYGKSYDLAKKRRLHEKKSTVLKDVEGEEEEEEDEDEDEGYDEGDDDDDDQSDDADDESIPDDDNISSDGEIVETPHPLQALLNSVDSHIVELEEERRELIERKEDREWRQRRYSDREYGTNLSMQSFASKK